MTDPNARILVVDDDKDTRKSLSKILGEKGYEIETAGTGQKAIRKAEERFYNLAILDIKLPDIEGTKLLADLKRIHPHLDVIIVTGYASLENTMQALNGGASSYMTKPIDLDELYAKIKKLLKKQQSNDKSMKMLQAVQRELNRNGHSEEKILHMATHDPLTGLPNRILFDDRLAMDLAYSQRNKKKLAVMLMDLDHFKDINDAMGHSVGDKLLQEVGKRLTKSLRKTDTVARMGGDEFLLLIPDVSRVTAVYKLTLKILECLRKPFFIDSHKIYITASLGISIFPRDGHVPNSLIKNADIAMYRAKESCRDNFRCFRTQRISDEQKSENPDERRHCQLMRSHILQLLRSRLP
jgi:two-component system cell cycle response regulator